MLSRSWRALKRFNFDGIDIDIETGLTNSGNINTLSTSQANLERIIDGVLAQMPGNFGLTMAPETAYVTGGSVTYGSIWGAYLPIIRKYVGNGRLWWLNMQYYNGNMYGCSGVARPVRVEGPDDLVDQLGRLERLDVPRHPQIPARA